MKSATAAGTVHVLIGSIGFAVRGTSFTRQKKDMNMEPV